MSREDYKELVKRYSNGRSLCNCGEAYYSLCGQDLACQNGCSANLIATKYEIAEQILTNAEAAEAHAVELAAALGQVRQVCLFSDDGAGEIGVTTDPHISEELFKSICTALAATPPEALERARARDACVDICREFVRRVKAGEIRSTRTYAQCMNALAKLDAFQKEPKT